MSRAGRRLSLAALGFLFASCASSPRTESRQVEDWIASAQALVVSGRAAYAEEQLLAQRQRALTGSDAALMLDFTLGWVRQERAASEPGAVALLAGAESAYRDVLLARPGHPEASVNLSLVLQALGRSDEALELLDSSLATGAPDADQRFALLVARGDLLALSGGFDAAREDWSAALDLKPDDPTVPARILGYAQELDEPALALWAVEFERGGADGAALRAYETLIARRVAEGAEPPAIYLDSWVQLAAASGAFERPLKRLPPESAWPSAGLRDLRELAADPARALPGEPVRGLGIPWPELPSNSIPGGGAQQTGTEPAYPGARATSVDSAYWTASPLRRWILARALLAMADAMLLEEISILVLQESLVVRERALGMAPDLDAYEPGRPLAELADVGLEAALELAIQLHTNPGLPLTDGALSSEQRLQELLTTALSESTFEALPRSPEVELEYNGVLGLIYRERGEFAASAAHLARVVGSSSEPLPHLERRLANVLAEQGQPAQSLDWYLSSAEEYVELGAWTPATDIWPEARQVRADFRKQVDKPTRRHLDLRLDQLEELLFEPYGWHLTVSMGISDTHEKASDLEHDLQPDNNVDVTSFDDQSLGVKAALMYRFHSPFAVELGFTSLGGPDSTIVEQPPAMPDVLDNVLDQHPVSGYGPTAAVLFFPYKHDRLELMTKFGGWYWTSDVDVEVTSANNVVQDGSRSEDGFDIFYGGGLVWRVDRRVRMRLEYERYQLDHDDVDLFSVGLTYNL